MSRLISRDPFARIELHRSSMLLSVDVMSKITCDWCGSVRTTKSGKQYLYRYRTETDGGRAYANRGLFCCKACHDSFNS